MSEESVVEEAKVYQTPMLVEVGGYTELTEAWFGPIYEFTSGYWWL